jgi:hypothetical protein
MGASSSCPAGVVLLLHCLVQPSQEDRCCGVDVLVVLKHARNLICLPANCLKQCQDHCAAQHVIVLTAVNASILLDRCENLWSLAFSFP